MHEGIEAGLYWAYYKDHGWQVIKVDDFYGQTLVWDLNWSSGPMLVPRMDWDHYQRLERLKKN